MASLLAEEAALAAAHTKPAASAVHCDQLLLLLIVLLSPLQARGLGGQQRS
jgi:hypothetical protein